VAEELAAQPAVVAQPQQRLKRQLQHNSSRNRSSNSSSIVSAKGRACESAAQTAMTYQTIWLRQQLVQQQAQHGADLTHVHQPRNKTYSGTTHLQRDTKVCSTGPR
jgi:hypothetical protein